MKHFTLGFAIGFAIFGLLSHFITLAWFTCVLLGVIAMFFGATWLFFYLLEPQKLLPKLMINAMVHNPDLFGQLLERIYPIVMANIEKIKGIENIDLDIKTCETKGIRLGLIKHVDSNKIFLNELSMLEAANQ